jgi:hypothetical protein
MKEKLKEVAYEFLEFSVSERMFILYTIAVALLYGYGLFMMDITYILYSFGVVLFVAAITSIAEVVDGSYKVFEPFIVILMIGFIWVAVITAVIGSLASITSTTKAYKTYPIELVQMSTYENGDRVATFEYSKGLITLPVTKEFNTTDCKPALYVTKETFVTKWEPSYYYNVTCDNAEPKMIDKSLL